MTTNSFTNGMVRGFFDADGSFQVRVYCGKNKIGFHVNIILAQKDQDVIEMVLDQIKYGPMPLITKRNHSLSSGNTSTSNSKSIAFSHQSGEYLRNLWSTNPPNAPTKYLDYKIALVLFETNKRPADQVVKDLLPTLSYLDNRVSNLSLLFLRYKMFGKQKPNKNPNLKDIKEYYTKWRATDYYI